MLKYVLFTEINSLIYHPHIIKSDIIEKRYLFSNFLKNKVLYIKKKKSIFMENVFIQNYSFSTCTLVVCTL